MTFDELFDQIQKGEITKEEAQRHFSLDWMETASKYILDINRGMRTNIPEIIYGEYKTLEQTLEITTKLLEKHPRVVIHAVRFIRSLMSTSKINILYFGQLMLL